MLAAVQTLLFSRDRQKNNRCRELKLASSLAQNAGAFQAHRRAAAIVIRSRRTVGPIKSIAVARVVMAGYQHDAIHPGRDASAEHPMNNGDVGRLRDAVAGGPGESGGLHPQAAAATLGVALKLR